MSQAQKTPLAVSLNSYVQGAMDAYQQGLGLILPCTVTAVNGAIVTVNFEVNLPNNITLPPITIPIAGSQYVRLPVQVGDQGITVAANTNLGGITGLGKGKASLISAGNLNGLVFLPIGNADWFPVDAGSVNIYATENTILTVSGANVTTNTSIAAKGNISAGTGATGSFTTPTGQIVTVQNGIITNIY